MSHLLDQFTYNHGWSVLAYYADNKWGCHKKTVLSLSHCVHSYQCNGIVMCISEQLWHTCIVLCTPSGIHSGATQNMRPQLLGVMSTVVSILLWHSYAIHRSLEKVILDYGHAPVPTHHRPTLVYSPFCVLYQYCCCWWYSIHGPDFGTEDMFSGRVNTNFCAGSVIQ